jgi:hypothetical protein
MKARDMAATAAIIFLSTVSACGQPGVEDGGPEPATSADDTAEVRTTATAQPGRRRLGAEEHRVKLLVLPADAAVEVDGVPARRRDGVIELSGKVGQTYRVRLSRDAQHVETTVALEGSGASPPSLDLAALARAARPLGRGRLPAAATAEPAATTEPATALEPTVTSASAEEPTLLSAMRDFAQANEGQACVCPPAPEIVVSKCPNSAVAAAGKKPKGVLAGDSFE